MWAVRCGLCHVDWTGTWCGREGARRWRLTELGEDCNNNNTCPVYLALLLCRP